MLSPHLHPGTLDASTTFSPRMTNKEPFRPTPRVPLAHRPKSDEGVKAFLSPSYQDQYPQASSSHAGVSHPRLVIAKAEVMSSAPTSPVAERGPFFSPVASVSLEAPPKSLRLCRSTVNLRPSSPTKLVAPITMRPVQTQPSPSPRTPTFARPMTPSAPPAPAVHVANVPQSRPASPIKVRAKVTDGISPRKKPVKGPPPKPNIVKRDPQQGLGISMERAVQRSLHAVDVGADMSADASFSSSSGLDSDHTQDADTVTVHLRLRPLPPDEPSAWVASPLTSSVALQPALAYGRSSGLGNHNFDAVHVGSSNDGLYKSLARPLVSSVLSGFNALIFAYGQTASGKTFTLSGDDKSGAEGITQMAVKDLFRGIRSSKREREWLVRCSWIEVYNEAVKDLLDPNNIPQIRSSTSKGTFVAPLAEIIVTSPASIFDLLEQGQKHRHVNATDWNERSSRSHTAFKIVVESWARDDSSPSAYVDEDGSPRPASPTKGKKVRVSELVLVDLAGSEKYVTKGGQERRAEGANINKSLLTLGKVIFALSEKPSSSSGMAQQQHIPYRDSKLTRILQNSLSGNSKIAVVATLNQTTASIEESLSTIMFAKRIKKVQLSAQLNEVDAPESSGEAQALLVKYRREADDLRRLVRELQDRDRTRSSADATINDVGGAATQEYIEQVEERLKVLGSCVVRGEGLEDFDDHDGDEAGDATTAEEAPARTGRLRGSLAPVNRPATPSHLDFTISTAALRQQLHAATRRITSLEAKGASSSPQQKDELIAKLQSQLLEAEIALEATALQPLPKVREDVEAEFLPRIAQLEKELRESRELNEECVRECERLQKVNQRLVALAHKETSELVGRLKEEAQSPVKDQLKSRGTGSGVGLTPTIRRLKEAGEGGSGAGSPRERPKSVLGDMGMRTSNTIDSGASPSNFANSSPLKHKASARALLSATPPKASLASAAPASTARRGAKVITTSSSSSRGRRSASHDFSLSLSGATSLSAGAGAGTRKKSHLFKMAGGGGGGRAGLDSDEENADESALLDF